MVEVFVMAWNGGGTLETIWTFCTDVQNKELKKINLYFVDNITNKTLLMNILTTFHDNIMVSSLSLS